MTSLNYLTVCSWQIASTSPAVCDRARIEAAMHSEAVVIETCQRVEVVRLGDCTHGCPTSRSGTDAFTYLSGLAAGLESIVLGEEEIVGQIRMAARRAPPGVADAMSRAIGVGRAVRRQHGLKADAGMLFDLASAPPDALPKNVIVIGSGPTARRIANRARNYLAEITVASRSAPGWLEDGAYRWVSTDDLRGVETDMAFVCLGGDAAALGIEQLTASRVVDVSTPRRTEEADRRVVTLHELGTRALARDRGARSELRHSLEAEVQKAVTSWEADSNSAVGRLRAAVEQRRQAELVRLRTRHPEIPGPAMDALTRGIVNRLFHQPVVRLREMDRDLAEKVAELFALSPGGHG